jgi:hypothetical protein
VLTASVPLGDCAEVDPDFISESLTSLTAKAWLAEKGKHFHGFEQCVGEWGSKSDGTKIRNGRWELSKFVYADDGCSAPYLTKIKVMGRFLSDDLHEFIPKDKRRRHIDIHEFGWS